MSSIPQDDNGCQETPSETHPAGPPAPELPKKTLSGELFGSSWEIFSHSAGSTDTLDDCVDEIHFSLSPDCCGLLNYGLGFYSEIFKQDAEAKPESHFLSQALYDRRCGRVTLDKAEYKQQSPTVGIWTFNLVHSIDSSLCPAGFDVSIKAELLLEEGCISMLTCRWNSRVEVFNAAIGEDGESEERFLKFVWTTKLFEQSV